ncbi:PPE family protein, SVP subgroup, partial [Mycobacterium nebraskense]|uniref:PPE family protein, SVP subgroup n=1 Tax=Mycobacterium nebraskense TaxID=244292 RepID=UPI00061823ED
MSWAAMPPEIISGEIYGGAGSGPLIATAGALTSLATELGTTAAGWESTMSALTAASGWQGTGAAAAAAAAQTYISWLSTLQAAVEEAAGQASASAAAFETAYMTVATPAAIAANRAAYAAAVAGLPLTATLVATLEADYEAMWAQDVAAMSVYQAASAGAGVLPPLVSVTGTINPAADTAATTASTATSTASTASSTVSDLATAVDGFLGTPAVFNSINGAVNTSAWFTMNTIPTAISLGHTLGAVQSIPFALTDSVTPLAGGMTQGTMVGSISGAGASAALGEASAVGGLSVPAGWNAAAKAGTLASSAAPLEGSL